MGERTHSYAVRKPEAGGKGGGHAARPAAADMGSADAGVLLHGAVPGA